MSKLDADDKKPKALPTAVHPVLSEQKTPATEHEEWSVPTDTDWANELGGLMRNRRVWLVLVAVALIAGIRVAVSYYNRDTAISLAPEVHLIHPELRALDPNISLPGNVEAIEQASLFAHVSGYLKRIYVDEGDTVKKGQLLAEIDAPDVINDYNRMRSEMQLRKVTKERNDELLKGNVISRQEYDTVVAAYDEARARYQNAAENVDYTKIRASFDGSIARRYKYPGDLINANDKTPIFLLVNEGELRVVVNIPQVDISAVQLGNEVDIKVDSFPNDVFHGTVSRLDALLDEQTKTQRVLIDLPNPDKKLHAGMFANVILHFSHTGPVLMLPSEAVKTDTEGKSVVFLDVSGKAKETAVTLGAKQGDATTISSGLEVSDFVILAGITDLVDGEPIKAVGSTPAPVLVPTATASHSPAGSPVSMQANPAKGD